MGDFAEQMDAAAGPLKRMAAVIAQIGLSPIPADAGCCCFCPVYEPHQCDGWRAEGLAHTVPSDKVLGYQPSPTEVPVCRSCHGAEIRKV